MIIINVLTLHVWKKARRLLPCGSATETGVFTSNSANQTVVCASLCAGGLRLAVPLTLFDLFVAQLTGQSWQ